MDNARHEQYDGEDQVYECFADAVLQCATPSGGQEYAGQELECSLESPVVAFTQR
jgi:hypothetical protein